MVVCVDSFTENFGPTGILDQIYGSNRVFKAWLTELKRRDCAHDARTVLAQMEAQKAEDTGKGETFDLRPEYDCIWCQLFTAVDKTAEITQQRSQQT